MDPVGPIAVSSPILPSGLVIGSAPAAGGSFVYYVGRTINGVAEGLLGFRFAPSVVPIRPGPAAVLYAAPQAFGGVVPNSQYGYSDDYGILTTAGGVFSESTRDEISRANQLQAQANGRIAAIQAIAVVQQLDNVDLVANLAFRVEHYTGTVAEYAVIEAEATEVIRRRLSGVIPVSSLPPRSVDIGATVASVPAPPNPVATIRTAAGLPASFVGLVPTTMADGSVSVADVRAVRADVTENQRRQTALLQSLVSERVDP